MAPCPLIGSHQPALWHLDAARGPSTPSFDHLVGAGEKRRRNGQAHRGSGPQIDDQLKFSRKLYWQIGRFGPFQNPIDVTRRTFKQNAEIGSMNHQSPDTSIFSKRIDRRKAVFRKSFRDLTSLRKQKKVGRDQNSIRSSIIQALQSSLDLGTGASVKNLEL